MSTALAKQVLLRGPVVPSDQSLISSKSSQNEKSKSFKVRGSYYWYHSAHPIQVAWNSRNFNSVRARTVSAAWYNTHVQTSGIILSNIYRADDAPRYKRGNRVLLSICITNLVLYALTKLYYVMRNQYRDRKWDLMTEDERIEYLATTTDKGKKRLDFRFAH